MQNNDDNAETDMSSVKKLAKEINALTPRKLDPKTMLLILIDNIGSILVFGVIWMFNLTGDDKAFFEGSYIVYAVMAFVIFTMIQPFVKYATFKFQILNNKIKITWGLINKQERLISLNKIHNVAINRKILHRLLGVAVVTLESAGSGQESEVMFKVLSYEDALLIEKGILANRFFQQNQSAKNVPEQQMVTGLENENSYVQVPPINADQPQQHKNNQQETYSQTVHKSTSLLNLSNEELIRYGLISTSGIAIGGILALFNFYDVILIWITKQIGIGIAEDMQISTVGFIVEALFGKQSILIQTLMTIGAIIIGLITMLVMAKLVSIVAAFINLYQFELNDNSKDVVIEKGLFTRQKSRVPINKIQVWRIEENIFHRWFNRQTLKLDTAILAGGQANEQQRGISELVPIADPDYMQQLLNHWQQPNYHEYEFFPVHEKAWRRLAFPWVVISVIICIAGYFTDYVSLGLALCILGVVFGIFYAKKRANNMGVVLTDTHIMWKDGWLFKVVFIAELIHTHALAITHNPFDRRYDMRTLIIDTVGGTLLKARFTLPYLDKEIAEEIALTIRSHCHHKS